jgi:hypothetical protein
MASAEACHIVRDGLNEPGRMARTCYHNDGPAAHQVSGGTRMVARIFSRWLVGRLAAAAPDVHSP